jgi:hypothetical protein
MRMGLLQSQVEENQAQIADRKMKMLLAEKAQAAQDRLLNGDPSGVAPGGFMPSADGSGPVIPQGAAPQAGGLIGMARQAGIPEQIIQADVVFNGGKKISEILDGRTKPNWQNINGNLVNTNAQGFQGGLQAGMSAGSDGRVTSWQPDGQGGLVVGAPKGAFDTFGRYQRIQQGAAADFDPREVTPQGGPPQLTTRGQLVRTLQGPGASQIPPAVQGSRDAGRAEILGQELTKAQAQLEAALRSGDQAAAQRAATDVSSLNRELGRVGGASRATIGMPIQSSAEKIQAEEAARAAAARDNEKTKRGDKATDMLEMLTRAETLLKHGDPTESGVGALADKTSAFFGRTSKSAQSASALENIAAGLTMNVPRMEGPQGVIDVELYKTNAGMVGDRTKPTAERLAALAEVRRLQSKYAGQGDAPTAAQTFQQLPPAGQYKGKVAVNPSTGQRMRSNGLSWVEEK